MSHPTSHGKISTCDSACFLAFAETTEQPDRRFPASRSVISDGKPSTPVKVVFSRVPLPRMAHVIADQPFASLSRSLPLLACPLCKSQHPDGGICIIILVVLGFSPSPICLSDGLTSQSRRKYIHQNNCCKNDPLKVCIYTTPAPTPPRCSPLTWQGRER